MPGVFTRHLQCQYVAHVTQLVNIQKDKTLQLAPNLTDNHVMPGQYQKMRVSMAAAVLSHTTASALRFCASTGLLPKSVLTTAWFCDLINFWFDCMNARFVSAALFENSGSKLDKLQQTLSVMRRLHFTGRDTWKPIQTGVQLSTSSILDLIQVLAVNGDYKFLLPGRLTQDCVENLFSCIRGCGDSHPSCVRFRYNLRLVSLSQYMRIDYNLTIPRMIVLIFLAF